MEDSLGRGIALFNHGEFFECHETLEEVWRQEFGANRLFLQALIHLAVAFYHAERGNGAGAARQARKGLRKLAGYLPVFLGIDTGRLHADCREWLARYQVTGGPGLPPRIKLLRG